MKKTNNKQIFEPYFNPVGHIYETPDGRRLDSVTQILKSELGLWQFGTRDAAERGTRVHLACQYIDEERLSWDSVSEIDLPYVENYMKAKEDFQLEIFQNEIKRYHNIYLYAGMIDKIGLVRGVPHIIDIKTGAKNKSYKWQLAAYVKLWEQEILNTLPTMCLYLHPDGYATEFCNDCREPWMEFLALLSAFNVKKKYGFLPKQKGE